MTFSKLFATATLAVLPFAASANDLFSPFVQFFAGERGIDFALSASTAPRADAYAQAAANAGSARAALGESGFVFGTPTPVLSRAEVLAELRAAQRLGVVTYGEAGPPITTPAQEAMIARAGDAAASLQASATGIRR